MTQEKSPMESRNLCGKNVAKFRNLLAGSPSQEKLAAKMQLEGLNIICNKAVSMLNSLNRVLIHVNSLIKTPYSALNAASGWSKTLSWMFSQRSFTSALMN